MRIEMRERAFAPTWRAWMANKVFGEFICSIRVWSKSAQAHTKLNTEKTTKNKTMKIIT